MQFDDSAHPEWDQMYVAGLTAARIADLTAARIGSVKRHLERRRRVDPALAVGRAEAPRRPSQDWRKRLFELRDFIATHGRYPTIHGAQRDEKRLYVWLSAQRHALLAQNLGWERAKELGILGDWVTTDLERELDAHWLQRLNEVVEFMDTHGHRPRHRPAKSELESTLSIWLQTQNSEVLHGRIVQWRHEALNESLPGWRRVKGDQEGAGGLFG
ncbi:hypothetical protein CVV68_17090 [Arthrobacter livingstonensis]|uniref:Helicase-associated domain-containing protein n=1 Tax=Arthrobacter livingstonensis TaxID=670078 RepID=A0A2V5L3Q2_9MICC|nr:helicase associated domain-containing protein [Arthrobacter livingstonensis]PYI65758.1 hypothetical protein CVV68_17090 [Arthrobacter livingstonensis]